MEKTIRQSVNYSQADIIADIMHLYNNGNMFEVDPCFNKGTMYGKLEPPKYKFDIKPIVPDVLYASADNLPFAPGTVDSMIIDPPFIIDGENSIMGENYGYYKTLSDLQAAYIAYIREAYRVLRTFGVYAFKCQDIIHNRRKFMVHHFVMNVAIQTGFNPADVLIKLNKTLPIHQSQTCKYGSRSFHSYFLVFRKIKSRRSYFIL